MDNDKILKFRSKKSQESATPTVSQPTDNHIKEIVRETIIELFNSEIFQKALMDIIALHEESKSDESKVRHEVSELAKELAELRGVELKEIYSILFKKFKGSQTQAKCPQLVLRKEFLLNLVNQEKICTTKN
jgi:hypothetical protein